MIGLPPGVRVLVATRPVYFCEGAETLAALAKEAPKRYPYAGTVLVLRAKCADRIKILSYDGTGLCLCWKAGRLEGWKALDQDAFKWPPISDAVKRLSPAQLAAPAKGLYYTLVFARRREHSTAVWSLLHGDSNSVCKRGCHKGYGMCLNPWCGTGIKRRPRGYGGASRRLPGYALKSGGIGDGQRPSGR
jgi:transposase